MSDHDNNDSDKKPIDPDKPLSGIDESLAAALAGDANGITGQPEKKAEFSELDQSSGEIEGMEQFEVVMDIPVCISMEVGRANITIRNLMKLNQGSVIELDRLAGEPLDIMVNGTLIAHGEVVIVNDKFGIRLTDVMSQSERIKKLQ